MVTLSPEAVHAAGIETAPVLEGRVVARVTLTGTLAAEPWTPEEQAVLSEAEAADAKRALAKANLSRSTRLSAQGVISRQDLDAAASAFKQAASAAEQADAKRANLGLSGQTRAKMWEVRLWGLASLPESELPRVAAGDRVKVESSAFPGRTFAGAVVGLSRSADAQTRSFTVRIRVDDPAGALRPQMLATFEISGPARRSLTVPSSAVLLQASGSCVFVAEAGRFRKQAVLTGASSEGRVEILRGVSAGQRIVVRGAQILESERLKSRYQKAVQAD